MFIRSSLLLAVLSFLVHGLAASAAEPVPPGEDLRIRDIVAAVDAERIEADVRTLVGFGTRHTLSETVSSSRGIGAARRFIEAELRAIGDACGGCLQVRLIRQTWSGERRIPEPTEVVNVVAIQRGSDDPGRYVLMSGDIDSRVSDVMDASQDAPGANGNASGTAGVLEAARVLSQYRFRGSIVYAALSGEEQGLFGGKTVARVAEEEGWRLEAVLNNDMIGNIEGVDGVIDNRTVRIFSEGVSPIESEDARRRRRFTGGEVDGPSRQLARYVAQTAERYIPALEPMMVYRLDRFGRGGHQTPFADRGVPAVRIMEAHENYNRQHQDVRTENGIHYGDVIEGVNFPYAAKITSLNAAVMASLSWAPPPPRKVEIAGAVRPAATLSWLPPAPAAGVAGYRVYWRLTDAPQWQHSVWVGKASHYTADGLVIDNDFFGVASVAADGHESRIIFPTPAPRRR